MNLILLEQGELHPDATAVLTGVRAAHLYSVLRVAAGSSIRVGVVDGAVGLADVLDAAPDRVVLRCRLEPGRGPEPRVDVLLALPRPKVLKRLWAQLAALGVRRIFLTSAARVERDYFGTHVLDPATWRPLLLEGLQQARDTVLPQVSVHRRFRVLIEDELDAFSGEAKRLVAQPGDHPPIAEAIGPASPARILLAIGPEGGWTTFELELLEGHGFQAVGMGPRTLRTDTACVALLALAHEALRSVQAGSGPPP